VAGSRSGGRKRDDKEKGREFEEMGGGAFSFLRGWKKAMKEYHNGGKVLKSSGLGKRIKWTYIRQYQKVEDDEERKKHAARKKGYLLT